MAIDIANYQVNEYVFEEDILKLSSVLQKITDAQLLLDELVHIEKVFNKNQEEK